MHALDYLAITLFFFIMLGIGWYSKNKVKDSTDFFLGGGKVPWWLSGISHHVSGYSGAVFVAYAGIAYTYGFTLYIFWAVGISIALFLGSITIIPRWPRLRQKLNIQSPTEYMQLRYGLSAQQLTAWSGVIVKLLDVGAKWASIGILLSGFTGLPIWIGILISGFVSLFYASIGGMFADLMTDFAQFIVQITGGLVLFFAVLKQLGGPSAIFTIWDQLPPGNSNFFNGPYTPLYVTAMLVINFLSYTGGTWNLAVKFIATSESKDAKRSARLSAILYFIWPLILFFPMWAGPILFPGMENPANDLYSTLTTTFLPPGLVGLVLAAMFANTMSMTVSDSNTISAVITRDILPAISEKFEKRKDSLALARTTTVIFIVLTILVALFRDVFGDVVGLILGWFAALLGPTAIPLICGLFPRFKYSDNRAAILSTLGGFMIFIATKYLGLEVSPALGLVLPILTSFIIYTGLGFINKMLKKEIPQEVEELLLYLDTDEAVSKKEMI